MTAEFLRPVKSRGVLVPTDTVYIDPTAIADLFGGSMTPSECRAAAHTIAQHAVGAVGGRMLYARLEDVFGATSAKFRVCEVTSTAVAVGGDWLEVLAPPQEAAKKQLRALMQGIKYVQCRLGCAVLALTLPHSPPRSIEGREDMLRMLTRQALVCTARTCRAADDERVLLLTGENGTMVAERVSFGVNEVCNAASD